jgi:hypothetical protein
MKRDALNEKPAYFTGKAAIVGGMTLLLGQPLTWAAQAVDEPLILAAKAVESDPKNLDDLFGLDDKKPAAPSETKQAKPAAPETGLPLHGFVQFEAAYTAPEPEHWSKLRTRAEVGSKGVLGDDVKWVANVRLDYDAVFSVEDDFYPSTVADDQRFEASIRETYLDIGAGDWDFRLGRQHVVWGEMIGLFFADVVSARDLREFILPEFDAMRIPQWSARAEYFKDDFHAELLWIPIASYDDIGKPGAEFYPLPGSLTILKEDKPDRTLDHTNYGLRLSTLKQGWDISGFYYGSMDREPTFYRQCDLTTCAYQARHDRIDQWGGTLAKDFGSVVLKAEAVYTDGRSFAVPYDLTDADGVVEQDFLDWAIGLDFTLPADIRFNAQFFQRAYFDHDARIVPDQHENGYSLYLNTKLSDRLEAEVTWIASLNRTDWLLRPKLAWDFVRDWRLLLGADVFQGEPSGIFGYYDGNDRVYAEVRYSF